MGEAVAKRWAREGASVIATDVNDEAGQSTVDEITRASGRALYVHADAASEDDWKAVTDRAVSEFGGLHILHNNAAVHFFFDNLNDPMEKWDHMMSINLRGAFLGCRLSIPHMILAGGGAIVNTASVSGMHGVPLQGLYGSTKAAVMIMTRALARAHGHQNVRVNAICPGTIDTPMLRSAGAEVAQMPEELRAGTGGGGYGPAMLRLGTADEIASAVTFLVSDEASYVSGVALPVDGAMMA
jgi:hypothetical protein